MTIIMKTAAELGLTEEELAAQVKLANEVMDEIIAEEKSMGKIERTITKVLTGHTSMDTAYLVDDYPYGFRLRTQIRYWIEEKAKLGYRMVSQTRNPKNGLWNKPKAGQYCRVAMALYIDEKGHVTHAALSEYSEPEHVLQFAQDFPGQCTTSLVAWSALKTKYTRLLIEENKKGLSGFTVNGVAQAARPTDLEEHEAELKVWEEIFALVKAEDTKLCVEAVKAAKAQKGEG